MEVSLSTSIDLRGIQSLFNDSPPSAQEIASFKIALSLWYNYLFGDDFDRDEDELGDSLKEEYRLEVEKSLQLLSAPNLIKDLIKDCLLSVENEFDKWINYKKYEMLLHGRLILYRSHLKCCVWQSDGKIDYKRSAQKMLTSDDFSSVEKFCIMCKYCMESEIKNIAIDAELEEFFEEVDPDSSALMYYWICYKKNEPHLMTSLATTGSVASYIIAQTEIGNWHAIEYFWQRLTEQEQITSAARMFNNWFLARFQKKLLAKMNESQLLQLFADIPIDILHNFWLRLDEREIALALWARLKKSLTGEHFVSLMSTVIDDRIGLEDYTPTMIRLWDSADDRHKSYLLRNRKDFIIKHYFERTYCSRESSLRDLSVMLSHESAEYRFDLMNEHGYGLTVNSHFSEVDKIIKLCLPAQCQVVEFKKSMFQSAVVREHCSKLYEIGEFEYLNEFVDFYSLDESTAVQFKKQILESNENGKGFKFEPGIWREFEKFIDQVYPDSVIGTDMKKRSIMGCGNIFYYNWWKIETLQQFIEVVIRLLTEEEMVELKNTLKSKFRQQILMHGSGYWNSFSETYWEVFSTWCLGSVENVQELKRELPLDKGFDDIMEHMLERYIDQDEFREEMLSGADKFLTWYLGEPQKVKEYKLSRVFAFSNVEIIEASIARREEHYTRILLAWFLDNDEQQIYKFRSEFSDEKISKFI